MPYRIIDYISHHFFPFYSPCTENYSLVENVLGMLKDKVLDLSQLSGTLGQISKDDILVSSPEFSPEIL